MIGEETLCKTLYTFDCAEINILYTDNKIDDEGNTKVYASSLNPLVESVAESLLIETDIKVLSLRQFFMN